METVTDRMTRYLLKRIRRRAVLDLYESAALVGLLTSRFLDGSDNSGMAWSITDETLSLLTGDHEKDRAAVAKALQRPKPSRPPEEEEVYDFRRQAEHPVVQELEEVCNAAAYQGGGSAVGRDGSADRRHSRKLATIRLLALLREHLPRPNPVQVAVALLVARAVGSSIDGMQALLEVLRRPSPYLLLRIPVEQFERRFGVMLEDGLIVPSRFQLADVMKGSPISGRYPERRSQLHRIIATLSGREARKVNELTLRRNIADVLLAKEKPLVIADEASPMALPLVARTPDLALVGEPIDRELIAELLLVCLGIAPKHSLNIMEGMKFDPRGLGLDDLALAVRPGRHVTKVVHLLSGLAERSRTETGEDDGEDSYSKRSSSSGGSKVGKDKPDTLPGEVIEPEPVELPVGEGQETPLLKPRPSRATLRVETLTGYGEATGWALDLKEDLHLWRNAQLDWSEMSTRLLLSGPPGTGKTTFARALCNTLQVPLIATSVASWLEPGYLGDVLKRITAAFMAATARAPCILFIDELDNIGSRGGGTERRYDDYWTSLVNRLLELLDGASKTEGVIVVGATNLPERIDPALLRSGRLEKHVVIPPPDTDALMGILAHHLGEDLADVLASAPSAQPESPVTTIREGEVPPPTFAPPEAGTQTAKGPDHA